MRYILTDYYTDIFHTVFILFQITHFIKKKKQIYELSNYSEDIFKTIFKCVNEYSSFKFKVDNLSWILIQKYKVRKYIQKWKALSLKRKLVKNVL